MYLWVFMCQQVVAFVVIIVLPLTLAWVTEPWADRSERGQQWLDAMGWLPVPMMGVTLFLVIAFQLPRVRESLGQTAAAVPVYVVFFAVILGTDGYSTERQLI